MKEIEELAKIICPYLSILYTQDDYNKGYSGSEFFEVGLNRCYEMYIRAIIEILDEIVKQKEKE